MVEIFAHAVDREDIFAEALLSDPVRSGSDPAVVEAFGIDLADPPFVSVTGGAKRD